MLAVAAGGDGDLFFDEAAGLFVEAGGGELFDFVGEFHFGRGFVGSEGVVEEFEDGAIEFGFINGAAAEAGTGAGGFFVKRGSDAGAAQCFGVDQVHGAVGVGGEGDHQRGGGGGADVVDGGSEAGVVGIFLRVGAEELISGGTGDVDGFVAVELGVSPVGGAAEEADGADGGGLRGIVAEGAVEIWLVGGDGEEGGDGGAVGVGPESDAVGVEVLRLGVAADPADGGLGGVEVVGKAGEGLVVGGVGGEIGGVGEGVAVGEEFVGGAGGGFVVVGEADDDGGFIGGVGGEIKVEGEGFAVAGGVGDLFLHLGAGGERSFLRECGQTSEKRPHHHRLLEPHLLFLHAGETDIADRRPFRDGLWARLQDALQRVADGDHDSGTETFGGDEEDE